MTVEIWGKVVDSISPQVKGKGKQRADYADDMEITQQGQEWKVLEHWEVDLNDLIPLSDDVRVSSCQVGRELMTCL